MWRMFTSFCCEKPGGVNQMCDVRAPFGWRLSLTRVFAASEASEDAASCEENEKALKVLRIL